MAGLHLGFRLDAAGKPGADRLVVESSDLTTHGAILGMTGSGKTGLGIVLIEEALLAGIPCLVLDPKGDMGNLLLTFPELDAASFRPWVNEDDARSEGVTQDEYAQRTATIWRKGLEDAGIGADRIRALREAAEFAIYTPGSESGIALNVVGSLAAPTLSWDTEAETLRDEIEGTVTSLLGLVGIAADPLSSREHVLLSNLVENAWRSGQSLDLGTLIGQVQSPPIRKLGVFEIDAFFPPKERTELALKLNALVASPSFAAWGAGQALDPATLLRTADGKPRCAIVYLAHLSDPERQFVVTLLLSKLVTWMRGQPGTSDLRTLVYMDEVFGFVPPTAMPPAKKPILTILKQGRAFGVGMVLATQNPVDLDYKAMANAGTWLVGRLQTERDKARVLEGLRSAAGGADVDALDVSIGGLQKRQFLLVSAKSSTPALFTTRWAMSYLRGPLTKDQIESLEQPAPSPEHEAAPAPSQEPVAPAADESAVAPAVADGVPVRFLDPAAPWGGRGRRRSRRGAPPRVSRGPRLAPLRRREGRPRPQRGVGGAVRAARRGARPRQRDPGRLRRSRLPHRARGERRLRAPASARRGGEVLPRRDLADPAAARRQPDARDPAQPRAEALLTARRDARAVRRALRPGGAGGGGPRDGEDPRRSGGEARPARGRARNGPPPCRGARLERPVAPDDRARRRSGVILGALLGGKRSTRSIASSVGSAASRRGVSARAAERKRTAEARAQQKEDELADLEQELLDEVAEIDARWREAADDVETLSIRAEAADIRVTQLTLLWVPTA